MMRRVSDFFAKFKGSSPKKLETVNTQNIVGDAALTATNKNQLDVNMRIDQDGRARVTDTKSDAGLNFYSQTALTLPAY